jgi:hypothetical protein
VVRSKESKSKLQVLVLAATPVTGFIFLSRSDIPESSPSKTIRYSTRRLLKSFFYVQIFLIEWAWAAVEGGDSELLILVDPVLTSCLKRHAYSMLIALKV